VYTECELNLMFTSIKDDSFNSFVRFAYYTGARSGEIRSISRDNVLEDSLVARGKSGRRRQDISIIVLVEQKSPATARLLMNG